MAAIMTKRGQQDNVITHEFICDTLSDLSMIETQYVTMGSVAIVIQGDSGFEVYMANSQKEWILLGANGTSNSAETSPIVDTGTVDNMVLQE